MPASHRRLPLTAPASVDRGTTVLGVETPELMVRAIGTDASVRYLVVSGRSVLRVLDLARVGERLRRLGVDWDLTPPAARGVSTPFEVRDDIADPAR